MGLDEAKEKLLSLKKKVEKSLQSIDLDAKNIQLQALQQKQMEPNHFSDVKLVKKTSLAVKKIVKLTKPWQELENLLDESGTMVEMIEEENDTSLLTELGGTLTKIEKMFSSLELMRLFCVDDDDKGAYLTVHAGAGGTESCDWAMMLLRMYTRFAERKGFKVSSIDYQAADEAGIRSATVLIAGDYATGHLRGEIGVHRLVRISPFDANKRRHTSFASVSITPELDDDIEIDLSPADIRVDTFRASGAGGQHVNTTDSAVRLTHIPTGLVVSCQAERSQMQNKDKAIKMLKAKLYEHEKSMRMEKQKEQEKEKKKIEWGSQVRSYIFHPYTMVKDHRFDVEVGDVSSVMDGSIEKFSEAFLQNRFLQMGK